MPRKHTARPIISIDRLRSKGWRLLLFLCLGCAEEDKSNPNALWTELIDETTTLRLEAEQCHESIQGWSETWSLIEEQVLIEVNRRRAEGADCGSTGVFDSTAPLEMNSRIRCSARYHSLWMTETGIYEHDSPGGELGDDPWQRMERTGFQGDPTGENIAFGYDSPNDVVNGWMASDGHCSNIMEPSSNVLGVGYVRASSGTYEHVWTQNFGYFRSTD